jgi:hypothetical protein
MVKKSNPIAKEVRSRRFKLQVVQSSKLYNRKKERTVTLKAAANKEKWVDISAPKKGGGFKECGRASASGSKRGYPKCVPAAKAARMSKSERASAIIRKRKAGNVGPTPTNVATFTKKSQGGLINYYKGLV